MSTASLQTRLSPNDLLAMPEGKGYELVDGVLLDNGRGAFASWVGGELFCRMRAFVADRRVGHVFSAGFGYTFFSLHSNTVYRPSVSFVGYGQLQNERPSRGFESFAPDLVAETISPWGLSCQLDLKIERFLEAGTRLFWVINCDLQIVHVYRADGSGMRLRGDDHLDGEDVLPGFSCRLGDIFLPPAESDA